MTGLLNDLQEARERTLELIEDLTDEQMIGPRLAIVNPLRWEIGHVGWFQEYWILRHYRRQMPIGADRDRLYDSAAVAHDTRWDLLLPSKAETVAYIQQILKRVVEGEGRGPLGEPDRYNEAYFIRLALLHEYMHAEAITYTRQTLGYPPPRIRITGRSSSEGEKDQLSTTGMERPTDDSGPDLGDAEIPGGTFHLGSTPDMPFVFDNEQWAHPVTVKAFRMARGAVTNREFAAFVEDEGYKRREFWTDAGWIWRETAGAEHPVYWQNQGGGRWLRRNFDAWVSLEPRLPVLHVNWHEADAYCRWARRRLPTEAEWEFAAGAERGQGNRPIESKLEYPWGEGPANADRANLEWRRMGCLPVDALPAGENAFGCRQMIGNVWEWTATDFGPYPGFSPGPYKEYSAPWFGDHKVLRGGCWVTRPALIRNQYRNFYQPHRRDVWAGFRTCALTDRT